MKPEEISAMALSTKELDLALTPTCLEAELSTGEEAKGGSGGTSPFHRVRTIPGLLVTVRSQRSEPCLVRLSVESASPEWRAAWMRWTFARLAPAELEDGSALAAQDRREQNGTVLQMLLRPGQPRLVRLECVARLDEDTQPGDYPFTVRLIEEESRQTHMAVATLRLCLPASRLLARLPALYADALYAAQLASAEPNATPFFARFLGGIDAVQVPLWDQLERLDVYFSPRTAPAEFLPWLATWVSLVLDESWPELTRRRLIREAVSLYRWRGTAHGLARYLEIYTGTQPTISDQPLAGMRLGPQTRLGEETRLGDVRPHTFVVTLPFEDGKRISETMVRRIIDAEKPAHTTYDLRLISH